MSNKSRKYILSVSARVLLAVAFVFGQAAWARQNQGPQDKSDASGKAQTPQWQAGNSSAVTAKPQAAEEGVPGHSSVAEETSHHGGNHEGIKVHGHWTIEVRNPDGSVVTHQEFENALQSTGGQLLAALLARQGTVGLWEVDLAGSVCTPPGPLGCQLFESNFSGIGYSVEFFPNLSVTSSAGSLLLSGTVVAIQSGNLTSVSTAVQTCPAAVAPNSGCGSVANPFSTASPVSVVTSRTLDGQNGDPPPVSVSAGQTIAVTVNISFS